MRSTVTLITGAGGEIGHGLIERLHVAGHQIVTIDLAPLAPELAPLVVRQFTGSITDASLLERVLAQFEVDLVFHLAALLSTRSEFTPLSAHQVNVDGTLTLLEFAQREGESHGRPVVFVYPSSIAAYGLPDAATRADGRSSRDATVKSFKSATDCMPSAEYTRAPLSQTRKVPSSPEPDSEFFDSASTRRFFHLPFRTLR